MFTAPGFVAPPPGVPPYGHVPPAASGMYGTNYAEDPMADEVKGFQFNDTTIRQAFIRLVEILMKIIKYFFLIS